ncbi:MAG: hypothetical protein LBT00_16310 [Spirochaetaceae bacterium]|jgi:hypothetical protein|nr:hypothetical protein [Spirochaetaceae bacterium]
MRQKVEKEEQTGKKAGGKPPSPPKEEVPGKMQYNFTDSESRIMKGGTGKQFEQAYNAQAAVDAESMLIVGEYVTNHGNDREELAEAVKRIAGEVYQAETGMRGQRILQREAGERSGRGGRGGEPERAEGILRGGEAGPPPDGTGP